MSCIKATMLCRLKRIQKHEGPLAMPYGESIDLFGLNSQGINPNAFGF